MSRRGSLQDLLDQGVAPHAATIDQIHSRGDLAVVVHKPGTRVARGARMLGWDGRAPAFGITRGFAEKYLAHVDDVTGRWIQRQRPDEAKVFVVMGGGTVLLNFTHGAGYAIEPGSLDESVRRRQ